MTEIIPTEAETGEEYIGTIAEETTVAGVSSLDGETGDLTLKTVNGNSLLGEGDIEIQSGVTSVNGQTGDVTITASGIGAATESSLENLATTVSGKQDALSSAQLAAVNSGIDSTKVGQIATNATDITTIEGKIPSAATSSNQLADKNFVNSSVATNTANYISNNGEPFDSVADLEAYSGPLTNNDYAFVVGTDSAGNTTYTRYKYNAATGEWAEEYVLNNSSFTSDQWAAINSGITSDGVTKLGGIESGAEVNVQANWNESDSASDAYIQNKPTIPKEMVVLSYGSSTWNDFITAYQNNAVVYCRASSSSNPGTGSQTRMAFMAYVNDATSPTEVEFQYYRSVSSHTASQQGDQVFVYKLNSSGTWSVTTREAATKVVAGTNMTSTYSSGTLTLDATDTTYSAFTGTDGTTDGAAGLVPAPLIADADKFLKSDGTWATAGGGGGGGVVELTSADYNHPANNPNKVCLGLLPPGYYIVKAGTKFYPTTVGFSSTREDDFLVEVSTVNLVFKNVIYTDTTGYLILYRVSSNGVDNTSNMTQNPGLYSILTGKTVIDNLTSNYAASPLSANQGKALNDKIGGDLSSLTTTDKTSLIAAINELASRIAALE